MAVAAVPKLGLPTSERPMAERLKDSHPRDVLVAVDCERCRLEADRSDELDGQPGCEEMLRRCLVGVEAAVNEHRGWVCG